MDLGPTPAFKELHYFISRTVEDPEKAHGYAERLYERIGADAVNTEHLRLRAEATNAALVDDYRTEVGACRAVLRVILQFTGGRARVRQDDTAIRVYNTIARFNLGGMFRPGGSTDAYRIPDELTEEN